MSKHLPQEVVEQILFRLPIKSLVRFSPVSKEWYKMVYRLKPIFLLVFSNTRSDDLFCLHNDGTIQEYAKHVWDEGIVENENTKKPDFHCYGNGLFCFSDDEERLTLWNPSICRTLLIPKSDVDLSKLEKQSYEKYAFGIVVDRITNDYKILRTAIRLGGPKKVEIFRLGGPKKVEIFRLSTGSWEVLNCEVPFRNLVPYQVDLKGMSYWVGVDRAGDLILVSFDGHAESFGSVTIDVAPLAEHWWYGCLKYLFLFDESLVFIYAIEMEPDYADYIEDYDWNNNPLALIKSGVFFHPANNEDYDVDARDIFLNSLDEFTTTFKIWKMDCEGKSLNIWSTISFYERAKPLGFRENGELLWLVEGRKLISTDLEKGSYVCLGYNSADHINSCPNYVESLALWKHRKFQTQDNC